MPISLTNHGNALERRTWSTMQAYISKYEILWQMHVEPLRNPGSIDLRDGIDPDFELFAMNHYSAYVNLVRALEKIEVKSDDLGFAEEIWAQLQRAVEVAIKQAEAFADIYFDVTNKRPQVHTRKLRELEGSIKEYRNILHEPIQASVKNADGIRLIPRRETLQKYKRWTNVMYHRAEADFVAVDSELRADFNRVCGILQGLWDEIEQESNKLLENRKYLARRSLGKTTSASVYNPLAASATSNVAVIGTQGPWWK
ncbi:MAG TPA: hypothetical protein VJ999_13425 [Candidatus Sulfotelmatobacter sp.]|nr:hypothetical protein [Candidatus Sulfotelmatobacter sp.]